MLFDDETKGIAQAYLTMLEAKKDPKMDPVGKEDGDIDNDGDEDSSDEYLKKRRMAISKSVKKEAVEITIGGKSEVSKKGMKDKEGGDEEEESDDDDDTEGSDDKDVKIKTKKSADDGDDKKKKEMPAFMKKEGYASAAQRKAVWASKNEKGVKEELKGNQHKLDKNKNGKLDKQDFEMLKKESTVWNWDEIIEASDEEIDALIETLEGDDLESFMSEFNELSEMYTKATPGVKKDGQEKLEPRAPAEKAFADMHKAVEKDHPFDKNQHDQGVKSQAKARPGDKRANEPMKTLKDIRK
jgi:ribosomal protein L12E/L44/L45/RPP1/RPP2